MPQPFATYFTFAEFNSGKPSSLEQFQNALSGYHRDSVVALCSAVNCLLKTWEGGRVDSKAHDLLARTAFSADLAYRMSRARENVRDPRVVFHRQQLLFVAKAAALYCQNAGINPLAKVNWGGFGAVLLMANDQLPFLFPPAEARDEQLVNTLAEFVPVLELSGPSSIKNKTARAHTLSAIAAELTAHQDFVDIAGIFGRLAGMNVLEFRALCFASMTKYMQLDLEQFQQNPGSFFLARTWFDKAALDPAKVNRFLVDVSAHGESLKQRFEQRNAGKSDFTPIRDKPIYVSNDKLFPIDAAFLGEKLETGIFWTVHNSLSGAEKQRLHRFWGYVFQIYMDRLLSSTVDGNKNIYVPSPRYVSDGQEVCDGLILCGSSVVLLEYKGATFTAESKYSGDSALLAQAIDEKLVAQKGVRQLANAVQRLFTRDAADQIVGANISNIRSVFPVLVTRDGIGGALVINLLLNRKFEVMFNRRLCRPRIVTPLFCMDAKTAEIISAYLREARLDDILDARYRNDPRMMSSFQQVPNPVLESIGRRQSEYVNYSFDQFVNSGLTLLFPGEHFETEHSRTSEEAHDPARAENGPGT